MQLNEQRLGEEDWNPDHYLLWAIGALAAFLYDLREDSLPRN